MADQNLSTIFSNNPVTSPGADDLFYIFQSPYGSTNDGAIKWSVLLGLLIPSQTGNSGKFLTTNGTTVSWATINLSSLGAQAALGGTGFVKISGTSISYDNSTYLTTSTASSTYAPIASPTFTGTITTPAIVVSSETASTLAYFDASKNIKSLDTASYPSLAEIAYAKGLTSAVQTQLNALKVASIPICIDGGGSAIANSTISAFIQCPYAGTITAYSLIGDTGTFTVKWWKIAAGTAIPTSSNAINTSGVSLSSGTVLRSTTLSDFTTTTVAANDIIAFQITAISGATKITAALEITKS